jgi:hypothetical protein
MSCWLLTASVLVLGCGSGGIPEGIPPDASANVTDPMAGAKLHTISAKNNFKNRVSPKASARK